MIQELLVATTTVALDDVIVERCRGGGVRVFRGSELDALDRYYRAAEHLQADVVGRIRSDCPLIDPEVTDATIQASWTITPNYASNVRVRTHPRGLDTEVMTVQALERAWREARRRYQREHVTPYIYEHPGQFKLHGIENDSDCTRHRWTLDTPEDLEFLQAVYARFGGRDDFGWREVLELVGADPSLADINRHVAQKAVHEG
jgi:spore coat polysaccharide biosynthesis protein SpsF